MVLMTVFSFVFPDIVYNSQSALTKFKQVISCLMRLRLNLSVQDLAFCFNISTSTASKCFSSIVNVLYCKLKKLVK